MTRKNNPPAGLVTPDTDQDGEKKTYAYDPHLDPQLQWAGKTEHTSFDVPTVSLHVHERIDPHTIIEAVEKRNGEVEMEQPALFETPEENPPLRQAIDFYKHEHSWSNRVIAGDSLLVMNSLLEKEGLAGQVQTIYIKSYLSDFSVSMMHNIWTDMIKGSFTDPKVYVVQTNPRVIARCLLMTTDPGDLVLDPTCGSGTTAVVAEQWGRRWITCDTSRVAVALAKQRLMTSLFNNYELARPEEGVGSGFRYKTVPHITLGSIANNPDITEGMSREEIDAAIAKHAPQETPISVVTRAGPPAEAETEVTSFRRGRYFDDPVVAVRVLD